MPFSTRRCYSNVGSVWKAVDVKNTGFWEFISYQPFHNFFNTAFSDAATAQTGFPPNEQLYYYY